MTASGRTPRRSISGNTSAALPSRPTETALRSRVARSSSASASSSVSARHVEVARVESLLDALGPALDRQHRGARHRGRERLCAAHAAEPGGEDPAPAEVAAVVLASHLDEGLVGALHDALAADVDPRAGRHLAVHHQALAVELVEVVPGGPAADEVRVRDQHARCVGVRAEDADGLAGLHQQRLVVAQLAQRTHDAVVAVPVARGPADAAVDDEIVGPLGDLGVEVVHQHAQRRLGEPAAGAQGRAARGADVVMRVLHEARTRGASQR